jgi:ABC-2 type transport system permease protein
MLIINLGLYSDGEDLLAFALESIADYFYVEGTIINGYLIAYLSLNTLWVHIPLLIIIVTTYIFSSEFEYGTIKVIMSQPISRFNFMFSKIITMIVFNILFMALVALFALIPSIFIFGVGDVMVFISGIQFILEDTFLFRFFSAVSFATIAMIGFSSMAMYLALYYKNTLTAILVSFGILIVCTLFQTFVFGLFSSLQPFMFTYHMSNWQLFFVSEIPYDIIFQSLGFMILMSVVFITASIYKFNRMNILE